MRTRLTRQERRLVLVLLDHINDTTTGRCSCGYTCNPGAQVAMATHLAHHLTDALDNPPASDSHPRWRTT